MLEMDAVARAFMPLVLAAAVAVALFAAKLRREQKASGRLLAALALSQLAMLGLLLAQDWLAVVVCWELLALSSYVVIGQRRGLLLAGGAGLLLLAAGSLSHSMTASWSLEASLLLPAETGFVVTALLLLAVFLQCSQRALHSWRSAPLFFAGVLLLFKLLPALGGTAMWNVLTLVGLFGFFLGSWMALVRTEAKDLLAYTSLAQLGLLGAMLGLATPQSLAAAFLLVYAQGLGLLPLLVVAELPGLFASRASRAVLAFSMMAVPGTLGFVAQQSVLRASMELWPLPLFVVAGVALGVASTWRMLQQLAAARPSGAVLKGAGLKIGILVFPLAAVVLGLWPGFLSGAWHALAQMNAFPAEAVELRAWYAFDFFFGAGILASLLGAVLHFARNKDKLSA